MVEIRDGKKVLVTPVSAEDLADIKIGDIVYLDGDLMTCRDVAHRRLVEGGRELPYDIRNKAIFHAGPIVRPIQGQDDAYEMVSVGPTTSMRMEKFEYEFTQHTGVRVIVGKGGMGPNTERACKEFGAIHCVFPAGCAVVAATEVQRIVEHHWDELGMPETLWCCKVKEFGPLIVSIDANGDNLFEKNKVDFNKKEGRCHRGNLQARQLHQISHSLFLYTAINAQRDTSHSCGASLCVSGRNSMTPLEITLLILLATILAFVSGKIPFAVISSGIILALILTGVMTPAEAFGGFINTNVVMFVAMFVIGAGLTKTVLIDKAQSLVVR